jgi:DNA-binding CsgD family transcriptional regulator
LAGRSGELSLLLESVTAPGGRGAVVSGAAGVGKSALVRAACARLGVEEWTVHAVRATRAVATIPFGAFVRFIPTSASTPVHHLEMLARLSDELRATAGDGRLLVSVDDAHLLDDSSAALIVSLVEGGAALLATVRSGEPLADSIGALRKDLGVRHLELGPLDREALDQVALADLGGTVDADLGTKLWQLSGGNPLFANELLRGGRQQGVIVEDDGRWVWSGSMPRCEVLHDVLRQHLDDGGSEVREVVEIVALAEPLSLGALAGIVPVAHISQAERAGLVAIDGDDAVRLAHPLFGELVRLEMGRARAVMIASALAESVGALDGDREVLRVASWQLQGSPATADPALLVRAAGRASGIGDPDTAIRFAVAALDRGAGPEAVPLLADSLYRAGRFDEVEPVAARVLRDPGVDSSIRRQVLLAQASTYFWGLGDGTLALSTLEAGANGLDRCDQHEIEAHHASICFFAGDVSDTINRLDRLLADDSLGAGGRVRAGTLAATALALAGRVDEALLRAEESLAACPQVGSDLAGFVGGALMSQALALITAGRLGDAEAVVRCLAQMAGDQRQALFVGPLHMMLGRILLLRGRLDEAVAEFDAADAAIDVDASRMLGWTRAMRTKAIAQSSGATRAGDALARVELVRHPAARLFELDVGLAEAWVLAAGGSRSAARRRARDTALEAEEVGALVVAAEAWHDLARLGDPGEAVEPLRRLAGAIEGPLVTAWSDHVSGLATRDGSVLDRAAERLEALGLVLHAAEAAADAADAHERAGRRGSALGSITAARRLRSACPGATPVRLESTARLPLHELTEREREIAELAARGHSNREIATQLFLSIRTVNNHLNHVYTKLGFNDRGHLAAALDLDCAPSR